MKPTPNPRRPAKIILDRTFRYTPSHRTDGLWDKPVLRWCERRNSV